MPPVQTTSRKRVVIIAGVLPLLCLSPMERPRSGGRRAASPNGTGDFGLSRLRLPEWVWRRPRSLGAVPRHALREGGANQRELPRSAPAGNASRSCPRSNGTRRPQAFHPAAERVQRRQVLVRAPLSRRSGG